MRSTFETEDLQAIAEMVTRKLAPLLAKVQEAVERPVLPPRNPSHYWNQKLHPSTKQNMM